MSPFFIIFVFFSNFSTTIFLAISINLYIGNPLKNVKELNIYTDIVSSNIIKNTNRLFDYLKEIDPLTRSKMILEDIYKIKDVYQVEQNLDTKLQKKLDENQREFLLREKIKLIKQELGDSIIMESDVDELNQRLANLKASNSVIERISREIKRYSMIPSSSPEISIIRNYIDIMLSLPWGNTTIDNDDLCFQVTRLYADIKDIKQYRAVCKGDLKWLIL